MDPNKLPSQSNGIPQAPPAQPAVTPPIVQPMPASGGHPEQEPQRMERPSASPVESRPSSETSKPREQQQVLEAKANLELAKEIAPGVSKVHHVDEPIKLPTQIADAGVASVPLPVGTNTYVPPPVILPLGQQQMQQGLHQNVRMQIRWLAEWCVKQLKEAHLMAKRKLKK